MFVQTDGEKEGRRRSGRSSTQMSTLGREFLHSHCSVVEVEPAGFSPGWKPYSSLVLKILTPRNKKTRVCS
jgi:hypothetical protein